MKNTAKKPRFLRLFRKGVFLGLHDMISQGLAKAIAKPSILPATIFSKQQVETSRREFDRFWGREDTKPCLKQHEQFATFTLKQPKSLWTYYFSDHESIDALKRAYSPNPFKVRTEDLIKLCGMHFKYQGPKKKHQRYLIVFNGNGELYRLGAHAWLFKLLKQQSDTNFDIIMFDHRECGFSKGKAHARGLIKDGEAIYSYVKEILNADDDDIDLCGFSLGAAVATLG